MRGRGGPALDFVSGSNGQTSCGTTILDTGTAIRVQIVAFGYFGYRQVGSYSGLGGSAERPRARQDINQAGLMVIIFWGLQGNVGSHRHTFPIRARLSLSLPHT